MALLDDEAAWIPDALVLRMTRMPVAADLFLELSSTKAAGGGRPACRDRGARVVVRGAGGAGDAGARSGLDELIGLLDAPGALAERLRALDQARYEREIAWLRGL